MLQCIATMNQFRHCRKDMWVAMLVDDAIKLGVKNKPAVLQSEQMTHARLVLFDL